MELIDKAKTLLGEVTSHWKVPSTGAYVAYKEYLMLSLGGWGCDWPPPSASAFPSTTPSPP